MWCPMPGLVPGWHSGGSGSPRTGLHLGLGPNDKLLWKTYCVQGSWWAQQHDAHITLGLVATPLLTWGWGWGAVGFTGRCTHGKLLNNSSFHSDLLSTYCIRGLLGERQARDLVGFSEEMLHVVQAQQPAHC